MYNVHLNRTTFNKAFVAQLIEHRITNLKDVGSSPTVGKIFSFCILSLSTRSLQVNWSNTNEIKQDVHPRCIERMII